MTPTLVEYARAINVLAHVAHENSLLGVNECARIIQGLLEDLYDKAFQEGARAGKAMAVESQEELVEGLGGSQDPLWPQDGYNETDSKEPKD